MSRSKWKGPYVNTKDLETFSKSKNSYKKTLISRNSEILPQFIEKTFEICKKKFIEVLVTEEMVGHKFGEFSSTRKQFSFKKKKTKN